MKKYGIGREDVGKKRTQEGKVCGSEGRRFTDMFGSKEERKKG